MFIWIYESECNCHSSTRKFAYTTRVIPPLHYGILARGTQYSAITAATVNGVHDVMLVEGNVNGEIFEKLL